jgi:glycosyltransferase involved in cell wall biosynthesis
MMRTLSANYGSVSVVIPAFNSARYIVEAIEHALNQSVPPREVIVIDDGSTDDTHERLLPYLSRIEYRRQANLGVSAARNHGVGLATGDFIAFLDADDVWHPRKLEIQLRTFGGQPDLGLLGTSAISWPGEAFVEIDDDAAPSLHPITWLDLAVKNRLTTSSVMARASVLRAVGEFDTQLQGPEDRDLWIRVARLAGVANLEVPLTGYRQVPGSVSLHARRCQEGMLRILGKLDRQGAWCGRSWVRRKAYAHVYHSCAWTYLASGMHGTAAGNVLRSLMWYPLPFRQEEVKSRFERPKRLAVSLLRSFGVRTTACPADLAGIAERPAPAADTARSHRPARSGLASRM